VKVRLQPLIADIAVDGGCQVKMSGVAADVADESAARELNQIQGVGIRCAANGMAAVDQNKVVRT
jgi:hypothetical protein